MTDEAVGTRKGDYEILDVLGAGGMGKVYKVRNVLSGRVEAMKVLLPDLSDQAALADRFLKEIKILANLNHPNIAALRTALTIDNQLVMIMEYVEGTTLAARLQQGPISVPEALRCIDQVLAALSYAHQQHVIHRDIKPANMMLTPEGIVKLMDFGIARSGEDRGLTMTGTTLGSVAYMSPEQVQCGTIDARSDLYSVGVSLYEMVTGKKPFEGENNFAVMRAHLEETPRPPSEIAPQVSEQLSKLILMAMAKDPAQRFQSADAFRAAMRSVAPNLQAAAAVAAPAVEPSAAMGAAASAQPGSSQGSSRIPPSTATIPMTAAQPVRPAAQPAATANPGGQTTIAAAATGSHRGMYIALGATIVVIVLIVAGLAVPRWERTRANGGAFFPSGNSTSAPANAPANQAAISPASSAASAPENAATPAAASEPSQLGSDAAADQAPSIAANSAAARASRAAADARAAAKSSAENAAAQSAAQEAAQAAAQAAAAAEQAAQLEALSNEMDQLSSRATAAGAGLNDLQRQQNAQGLGMRGDMVEAGQLMGTYMSRAQSALQNKDAKGARKYMDLADAEISKIEKFLGR